MALDFEWDPARAEANWKKHGVSFEEAATVFGDPLARLIDDPEHSHDEERFVLFGRSQGGRLLAVMHAERDSTIRLIGAREMTPNESRSMPSSNPDPLDHIGPEYDLSACRPNPYAARYAEGTNLVRLDPDVAKVFPDSESVNRALRALVKIIEDRSDAA